MKFSLFSDHGARNSEPVFDAMREGLQKLRHHVVYNDLDADVAVVWSILESGRMAKNHEIRKHFQKQNKPIVVLEVGSFQRGLTWKIGLNKLRWEDFILPDELNNRHEYLQLKLNPWNKNDNGSILLCGQNQQSIVWPKNLSMEDWFYQKIEEIRQYTNRKIIIRPHPRFPIKPIERRLKDKNVIRIDPKKIFNTYDDYDFFTNDIWAVVNHNSSPGVDAVRMGTPVFVDESSLAAKVGNLNLKNIENPLTPCREEWIKQLAYTEWFITEIKNGAAIVCLTKHLETCYNNLS